MRLTGKIDAKWADLSRFWDKNAEKTAQWSQKRLTGKSYTGWAQRPSAACCLTVNLDALVLLSKIVEI